MTEAGAVRKLDGFTLRLISALILAPAALACLFVGAAPFAVLVLIASALMAYEWNALSAPGHDRPLTVLFAFVLAGSIGATWNDSLAIAAVVAVVGVGLAALLARGIGAAPTWAATGLAYLVLPALALIWLRDLPAGAFLVLWLLLVIWSVDIGAYAAGRTFGGPRLAPRISPGKTWSGLAGGIAAGGVVAALAGTMLKLGTVPGLLVLGGALAILGQIGDLAESAFKRRFGAKDSGRLIPGHGGVLDRLDGLLAIAPVVAALVCWRLAQGGPPLP